MTTRLRLILPTLDTLALVAFCFLAIQGCRIYAEWKMGVPQGPGEWILRVGDVYLRFLGFCYGLFRVMALHPFYRPGYRVWLERTPWTSRKPLPIGPVSLVWEDGVVLVVLALLTLTIPGCDPARVMAFMLLGYLAALSLTLTPTGEQAYAYLLAFGLGLMVRLSPRPDAMLAVGVVFYAAGYIGLRRSLARFPWPLHWRESISANTPLEQYIQRKPSQPCGWPYDRLSPTADPQVCLPFSDALLISMLVGWWLYAVEALITDPREIFGMFAAILPMGTMTVAFMRLWAYVNGYQSPLNLWGRLWKFRWIVPGYDKVFVAPLCAIAIAPLSMLLFYRLGWRAEAYLPISFGLVLFMALAVPPRLRRWRLTGRHRIVPSMVNQKEFIKIG